MSILTRKSPLIIDGGTGTELERLGVPMNSTAWSAEAVISHPEVLSGVHRSFLDAGADILIANTFSTALHNLEGAGFGHLFEQVNRDAVRIVREVAKGAGRECVVASGISTSTFSGALDYSRLPAGDEAVSYWARQADIHVRAGAELIILEMMRDIGQTRHALEGTVRAGVPVWVGFSCFTAEDGVSYLLDTDIPLQRALDDVDLTAASGVGIMHTLIEHTQNAFSLVKDSWSGFSFAYPHAGHFMMPNWVFHDAITPDGFAQEGMALVDMGADAVGGCCGITPAHIEALSRLAAR